MWYLWKEEKRWRLIDSVQAVPAYIYLVFWKSWNDVLIFEPSIRFRTTPFSSGSEVKQPPVGNKLIYVFFSSYYIMNIIITRGDRMLRYSYFSSKEKFSDR